MVYIHYDIALGAHCGLEAAQGHLTLIQQLTQVWTPRWMPPPDRPETKTTAMPRDCLGLSTVVSVQMLTES